MTLTNFEAPRVQLERQLQNSSERTVRRYRFIIWIGSLGNTPHSERWLSRAGITVVLESILIAIPAGSNMEQLTIMIVR